MRRAVATTAAARAAACPVCEAEGTTRRVRTRGELAGDLEEAAAAGHRALQSHAADVYRCARCGSLFRDPEAVPVDLVARYRDDEYGEQELVRLHTAGRVACDRDRRWLAVNGVRWGARVLEVGSYAGALLATARAAGCRVVGVDVGAEVGEFTRGLGLDVLTGTLSDGMLDRSSLDAVFVVNCLEQMAAPERELRRLRAFLRPGGALVVRTPDAAFVGSAHRPERRTLACRAAVLGVPFVRCWSQPALAQLLRAQRFEPVAVRGAGGPWIEVAAHAA